jgi:hypothetical protein
LSRGAADEFSFPNPPSFLSYDEISTPQEVRARAKKVDLEFLECPKKSEYCGDFASPCEATAPKCGSGL